MIRLLSTVLDPRPSISAVSAFVLFSETIHPLILKFHMQVWNYEWGQMAEGLESASLDYCGISVRLFLGNYSSDDSQISYVSLE